jgi:hypothetical protein
VPESGRKFDRAHAFFTLPRDNAAAGFRIKFVELEKSA